MEVTDTAHGDVEPRHVALDHAAVEHDRRIGAALVGGDPVDDRVAPDLLLAVAGDAQVDRELAGGGEQLGGLEQHVELALVVGDAARVEPVVALDELERIRVPELERVGRLHVEVPVERIVGAVSAFCDARISPTTSGRSPQGITSALPPARVTRSATQPAAAATSAWCAASALTEGIAISSASSATSESKGGMSTAE